MVLTVGFKNLKASDKSIECMIKSTFSEAINSVKISSLSVVKWRDSFRIKSIDLKTRIFVIQLEKRSGFFNVFIEI